MPKKIKGNQNSQTNQNNRLFTNPASQSQMQSQSQSQQSSSQQSQSSQYQQNSKNPKKTKKIQKQSKSQKQKKPRQISGAKLGRPQKNKQQRIDIILDPTAILQQKILQHLQNIGIKHGLVFRKQDRQKLNKQYKQWKQLKQYNNNNNNKNKQINTKNKNKKNNNNDNQIRFQWKQNHQWQKTNQINKIKDPKNNIIQTIHKYIQFNPNYTQQQIISIYLTIGSIVADQCTLQIYKIFTQILISVIINQNKNIQQNRCKQLYKNNIIFMNGIFTNIKIPNWLQIIKNKQNILQSFINMFLFMIEQSKKILTEFKTLKGFIQQENQIEKQLDQIIAMSGKQLEQEQQGEGEGEVEEELKDKV